MGLGRAILAGLKKPKKPKYKSKYQKLTEKVKNLQQEIKDLDKNDQDYISKLKMLEVEMYETHTEALRWSPEFKARKKKHKEKMSEYKQEAIESGRGWKGVSKDPNKDKRRKNPLRIDN